MTLTFTEKVLAGNRRAIARLITLVENEHPDAQRLLETIYPHTGQAHLIGVTGSPGTGKSSLVNKLTKLFRIQAKTVAIIAVDPTSPFSGGAILGDRIRMRELSGDSGIFIRSMASRGNLGGLARAVDDTLKVLDAAGFDLIIIETVGAGQSEVEVAKTAHTVIVVEAPGMGDDVQAIKAGILEIADIFVVNKADRAGVDRSVAALKAMLELGRPASHQMLHHGQLMTAQGVPSVDDATISTWQIPVLKTTALKEEGIEAVITAIGQHVDYLQNSGELTGRKRTRVIDELESVLQIELMNRLLSQLPPDYLPELVEQLIERKKSPYGAVQDILKQFFG